MGEFAHEINSSDTRLSRIIRGWEYPSPGLQGAIAKGLGLTLRELLELL